MQNKISVYEYGAEQRDYCMKINNLYKSLYKTRTPKAFVKTYGCQQNVSDSEKYIGMLLEMGFEMVFDQNEADVVLFNTCAIRENAENKTFGNLGWIKSIKKANPNLFVILCGCMTEQESVIKKIKNTYNFVDLVFGTHSIHRFPELLYKSLTEKNEKGKNLCVKENIDSILENAPIKRDSSVKAFLSIMYGCNNFCSYCIVPYVRGRERSREPKEILKEFENLLKAGYKDITLLGQNVNSYCKDLDIGYDFADLLRDVNNIDGKFRIRFMTSHPKDATQKLFDTIAECDKVCKHVHLPFQSGSDRVLSLMNRRYTAEKYLSLVKYAKEKIPDVSFTSDVIVGFPTETEEDFTETLELIKEVGFSGLYTFLFSPRPGTPAATMDGQISPDIKSERFNRLLALQNENSVKANEKYIGKTVEVLVEGYPDGDRENMTGRTEDNTIVRFPAKDGITGEFVSVKIDKALNWAVFGRII